MKKIFTLFLMLAAYPAFAAQVTTYPEHGTPATASDALVSIDASTDAKVAKIPLTGDENDVLGGDGQFHLPINVVPSADFTWNPSTGALGIAGTIARTGALDEFPQYEDSPHSVGLSVNATTLAVWSDDAGKWLTASLTDSLDPAPTAPTVTSISVDTTGLIGTVVFDDAGITHGAGGTGGWVMDCSVSGEHTMTFDEFNPAGTGLYDLSPVVFANGIDACTVDYTQPGDGLEDAAGTDLVSLVAVEAINGSTVAQTYTMTLSVSDPDATGDTFTVASTPYGSTGSPHTIAGLNASNETISYNGSDSATCTGAAVTGAGPWAVDMSDSDESVSCEIANIGGAPVTLTFRPTGDGDTSTGWTYSTGTTGWNLVDESVADDADYLTVTGSGSGDQLYRYFTFDTPTVPAGATNITVTVYYRVKDVANGTNNIRAGLKVGSTLYNTVDAGVNNGSVITTFSYVYLVNPATASAWTISEANALAQFGVYSSDASPAINVYQVYMEVTYTP